MSRTIRSAFLVPFFGPLPPYFDVWAGSCEANQDDFHWFVYNDKIDRVIHPNPAVTLIPYQFEEMKADFKQILDITIPGKHLRRVCDYRLMFYFTRKEQENLDEFDFIGFTDMDMVYGRLMDFMPRDMDRYSMISADDDRPCGPFTLMNRTQLHLLAEWDQITSEMERVEHRSFNEAIRLMEILSQNLPAFCRAAPLQPQMAGGLNQRHHFGIWDQNGVTVHDCWQRKKQGGFYHFSRYKDKPRFKIAPSTDSGKWSIYKFGISDPERIRTKIKMQVSLYI